MTNISSLLNNGYSALNDQSSGAKTTQGASTASYLSQVFAASSSTNTKANSAYSLDLSADALSYIQSINGSSAGATSSAASATSFTLTKDQQATLDSIIAKYKDAPFTQETFSKIQDDLKQAGLSTDNLSMQDKIRSFNPTKVLLDALNGSSSEEGDSTLSALTDSSNSASTTDATTKSNNFMTQVADQWARISTTAKTATAS